MIGSVTSLGAGSELAVELAVGLGAGGGVGSTARADSGVVSATVRAVAAATVRLRMFMGNSWGAPAGVVTRG